ncbi:MAG: aldo/keto reductase [Propionibacteriaceae bacterium]|nr:aldo/keto reductase [Propionibacteriaceae bacterium]
MTISVPTITLAHGAEIPAIGLGTWPLLGDEGAVAVRTAIEAGYRLIDTAENYRNEEAVGQGVRDSGIPREQVFLTTKFNREWHSVDGARQAAEASLRRLGVDYLDLLLIHWPNPDQGTYVQAFEGLLKLLEAGVVRAIGTSNFKPAHLQQVIDATGTAPDVNQINLNPYATRAATAAFHAEHGIVTESWSPIKPAEMLADPVITGIAEAHGRSAAQVVLRWDVQHGYLPIPKSAFPQRQRENLAVFDFELTADEVAAIDALDQGEAHIADSDRTGH